MERVVSCLEEVEAARLCVAPGARMPQARSHREYDATGRLRAKQELALLDENALMGVTRKHELGTGVCKCSEHIQAMRNRPLARAPWRTGHVVMQRNDPKRGRRSARERRCNPSELRPPEGPPLPFPGLHRVETTYRETVREVRRLRLLPLCLEVRKGPEDPCGRERRDVVVPGYGDNGQSERPEEVCAAPVLLRPVAVGQVTGCDNDLGACPGNQLPDGSFDLVPTFVVPSDVEIGYVQEARCHARSLCR